MTESKGNVVYACFLLLGLGTLLPWNFFITAQSYWDYKFRDVTPENETGLGDDNLGTERTYLQNLYVPMQVCFSQIPNFVFLFINVLFSHKVPLKLRLIASLTVMILLFAVTTALTQVNTDSWQTGFFAITIIVIFFINSSGAIFQGSLFGVAGMFPERFMTAVMSGQAIGGVFASAARIVSLSVGAADATSAFIYFMIAVAVMILTMGAYIYMSKTNFFKYYINRQEPTPNETDQKEKLSQSPEEGREGALASHSEIMKEIWPVALSVSGVFFVTLAAFPVLCVKILSTATNESWRDVYFQPVATFLLFNVGDYVGRLSAGLILWPRKGSWLLYLMVALRLVFIPLFLLCNHDPKSSIPSVFTHDAYYIVIMLLFALSNGYCSSLAMTYGPKMVSESKAEKASSMMAAMLGLGLLMGGVSSFGFGLIS